MKKRISGVFIVMILAFILMPTVALAADGDVAQIGDKSYATLQEAIDAVKDGQTIKLLNLVWYKSVIITGDNKSFTLDLNGQRIFSGNNIAIRHSGSSTLTIIDSVGGGIIESYPTESFGAIYLEGGTAGDTVLIIKSGVVKSYNDNPCIANKGNGGVIITGTAIIQNQGWGQAIVSAASGKLAISQNAMVTSRSSDGTIYLGAADLKVPAVEITGGTIENTNNGFTIYSKVSYAVSVPSGLPVFKGYVSNKPIDLSRYADVLVMASKYSPNDERAERIHPNDVNLNINYYKYLTFSTAPQIAQIGDNKYTSLFDAFRAVKDGQTVVLLADINLKDETVNPDKNFTLDLNGKTITETVTATDLSHYLGMIVCWDGSLTITDSKGGGTIAAQHTAIYWGSSGELNIEGGLVKKTGSAGNTIFHDSKGKVIISGGVVQYGSGAYSAIIIRRGGTVEVKSGKVESSNPQTINVGERGNVIVSGGEVTSICITDDGGKVTVSGGQVGGTGSYAISDTNRYYSGIITLSGGKVNGYIQVSAQGKIKITGNVVLEGLMSKAPDLSEMIQDYEWRTSKNGDFKSSTTTPYVWSSSHNYLEIKVISSAETVSNILNTICLSGGGFQFDDLLNSKALKSGSDYETMMKLSEQNDNFGTADVMAVYSLSLNSGMKSTGSGMYLNFNMPKYPEQAFTLAYKKADGTYDFFYATSDKKGIIAFGPFYELSTVMLVKGTLPDEPIDEDLDTQAGGIFDMYILGINVWWFIGAVLVNGAGVTAIVVLKKRKISGDKQ